MNGRRFLKASFEYASLQFTSKIKIIPFETLGVGDILVDEGKRRVVSGGWVKVG